MSNVRLWSASWDQPFRLQGRRIDPSERTIESEAGLVVVEPRVMALLIALAQRKGEPVRRDKLVQDVWRGASGADQSLSNAVSLLRQALGEGARSLLVTLPKLGYRLDAEIDQDSAGPARPEPPSERSETDPGYHSIAVLPFADISEAGDQEYLADGVSEEILNALVKVPGLRVAGRTSSFVYKKRNLDVRDISAELKVAHILEGSIRKQGGRVRITVQLIEAEDGFHLWSDRYDGALEDIFDLQETIARRVVGALEIVLGLGGDGRLAKTLTRSQGAYDLFLRGRALVNVRAGETTLTQAVKLLERAVALDPGFAEAWAELARANNTLPQYSMVTNGDAYFERAEKAAKTALALDANLSRAHLAASGIDSRRFGLKTPHGPLTKAVELDPQDADALGALSYYRCIIGHAKEAARIAEEAIPLDPLNATNLWVSALTLLNTGDYETASAHFAQAFELGYLPALIGRAQALSHLGDDGAAQIIFSRALSTLDDFFEPTTGVAGLGDLFARAVHAGDKAAAGQVRAAMTAYRTQPNPVMNVYVLGYMLYTYDHDGFIDAYLSQTYSGDTYTLCSLWERGPAATALRGHPRFEGFCDAVGLSEVWEVHGAPDFMTDGLMV